MPRIIKKLAYGLAELSSAAKETARNGWREGHLSYDWWGFTYDDAMTIAPMLGITISTSGRGMPDIGFSGFYTQGSGAHFEGYWEPASGALDKVKAHAPLDTKLQSIAATFDGLAARCAHRKVFTKIKHSGPYEHSGCTSIETEIEDLDDMNGFQVAAANALDVAHDINGFYDELKTALRSFMDWIYDQLEQEYDHQMSDETIDASIIDQEAEFDEYGHII